MGPVKCLGKLKFGVFGLFFGVFAEGSKLVFLRPFFGHFWLFVILVFFHVFCDFSYLSKFTIMILIL